MRLARVKAAAAALLFLLLAPGVHAQPCTKGKFRVYTSWPMQGPMTREATGMKNGVDLAVSEVGGAIAGYCLEVVNLDGASPQTGKWDGAVEADNAHKAVGDPLAITYIGTYNSGAAKVSIPINNTAHMAQITPAASYSGLTKKRGAAPGEPEIYRPGGVVNFFRPLPADDVQGAVGARWAKALGAKKVYVIHDQQLYGKGVADVFEATAKQIGLTVIANEGIDWKEPDQKPLLTKIRTSGADLVYMGGVIETGAPVMIRQMKEVGLVAPRTRFMGTDGLFEEELLKRATCDAALATDMRVTFPGVPFDKMRGVGAKTYETYRAKFGQEPTSYALRAVEAGRVAVEGIRRAMPALERATDITQKREAVRKAIAATKNFNGITDNWSFDENGDLDRATMSGFKVVKADGPIGCKFQFDSLLEFVGMPSTPAPSSASEHRPPATASGPAPPSTKPPVMAAGREAVMPPWMGTPQWAGSGGQKSPTGLLWVSGLSESLSGQPEDSAKAWLAQNVVQKNFASSKIELRQAEHRPSAGSIFYEQRLNGVPVLNHSLGSRYSRGTLRAVSGRPIEERLERSFLAISSSPSVGPDAAAAKAVAFIRSDVVKQADKDVKFQVVGASELFYRQHKGRPNLAWRTLVDSKAPGVPLGLWEVWTDAHNGAVLLYSSLLRHAHGDVEAVGTGADRKEKTFRTYHTSDGRYLGLDYFAGFQINRGALGQIAFNDTTAWRRGVVGGRRDSSQAPEVDAMFYLRIAKEYFRDVFKVDVTNGRGGPLEVIVHDPESSTALWHPIERLLRFGDGDGKTLNFMTGELEIVAHEYAHAVIDQVTKTALRCDQREADASDGEPGEESVALNESLADVLALLVSLKFYNRTPRGGTWAIGKDVFLDGSYRDLKDPSKGGQYRREDTWAEFVRKKKPQPMSREEKLLWKCSDNQGAVAHINSSIPSRVAFLLLNGGQVKGITVTALRVEDVEKLYKHLLDVFAPNMGHNFEDAREAMIEAGGVLWPDDGDRHCQIKNAWAAVGVGRACNKDKGR